ncbi:PAS domain S-box protein, partial [Streptomyces violaceoruber]
MSEIPARAKEPTESTESGGPSADAPLGDAVWQSSPPGSIYDYIKVASFSIGPDGLVDQWSLRAEQLLGIRAEDAVGSDPIEAFIDPDLRERGQRKMTEILDGREWTGVVPFRAPDEAEGTARHASGRPADGPPTGGRPGQRGLAEVYVMPTRTEDGEKAAVCIVVDVRVLRSIETDLAASQAIFGQSPFGFLLIDPDLTV